MKNHTKLFYHEFHKMNVPLKLSFPLQTFFPFWTHCSYFPLMLFDAILWSNAHQKERELYSIFPSMTVTETFSKSSSTVYLSSIQMQSFANKSCQSWGSVYMWVDNFLHHRIYKISTGVDIEKIYGIVDMKVHRKVLIVIKKSLHITNSFYERFFLCLFPLSTT